MRVECFNVGPLATNSYLITNDETKETLIVDPGGTKKSVFEHVESAGLNPVGILLTHGHFDHITGVPEWTSRFPKIRIYAHEKEKDMLEDPDINMTHRWGSEGFALKDVNYVKDGEVLDLIGEEIKVIWTPGHTIGGCAYYFEKDGFLAGGDTLFRHSIGRTDMATGDMSSLLDSVKNKLFMLPDDVKVLTGHGDPTTIAEEKSNNPWIR